MTIVQPLLRYFRKLYTRRRRSSTSLHMPNEAGTPLAPNRMHTYKHASHLLPASHGHANRVSAFNEKGTVSKRPVPDRLEWTPHGSRMWTAQHPLNNFLILQGNKTQYSLLLNDRGLYEARTRGRAGLRPGIHQPSGLSSPLIKADDRSPVRAREPALLPQPWSRDPSTFRTDSARPILSPSNIRSSEFSAAATARRPTKRQGPAISGTRQT